MAPSPWPPGDSRGVRPPPRPGCWPAGETCQPPGSPVCPAPGSPSCWRGPIRCLPPCWPQARAGRLWRSSATAGRRPCPVPSSSRSARRPFWPGSTLLLPRWPASSLPIRRRSWPSPGPSTPGCCCCATDLIWSGAVPRAGSCCSIPAWPGRWCFPPRRGWFSILWMAMLSVCGAFVARPSPSTIAMG